MSALTMMGCGQADSVTGAPPNYSEDTSASATTTQASWPLEVPVAVWNGNCENATDKSSLDRCVGAYGFTVFGDGRFIVGPAPDGFEYEGLLTQGERSILSALALLPESDRESSAVSFVRKLAEKYYPNPFPNDCTAAVRNLELAQESVSQCETHVDCTLVNSNYEPIATPEERIAEAEHCALPRLLSSANTLEVTARQPELVEAREVAARTCGEAFSRANCRSGELSRERNWKPVCINNKCQLR